MSTYNVGNVEIALTSQMNEAVKAIKQLSTELNRISGVLNKTRVGVDNVGKSTRNVGNEAKKASKSLSGMFTLGKLYFFVNYTRRMAQGLAGIVQSAIDYTETLNKFEVSMGNSYERALAFQEKLHEAYGLAKADLMDYQANFNNIIKGLGNVDVDVAYNMSETLTTMAIDFASLFNTSIDSAMTKFQSALTQQVRPIRSVSGFDITTPTLKSVMQNIGITDRQISQLNQVEKRLLIIIALEQQMRNVGAQMTTENGEAMGDFARTIENPANQLKILSQQLKETGIAIGNLALRWIAPAIPYVLGFVMAIRTLIETLASLIGFEPSTAKPPLIEFEDSANSATGAVGKTKKAVEDLKKATTGIDELNIISQPKDTDTGGGVGGGLSGIDPRLLKSLQTYNTVLGKVNMKATSIRDRIMEWLGFTKTVDEETGEVTWTLGDGETNLGKIKTALEGIASILVAIGILKAAISFADWVSSVGGIVKSFSKISKYLGAIVLVALGIYELFDGIHLLLDDDVSNDVDGILKIIEGIAAVVAGVAVALEAWPVALIAGAVVLGIELGKWLAKHWEEIVAWIDKIVNWFGVRIQFVADWITTVFENIGVFFHNLWAGVVNFFVEAFEGALNWIIRGLNKVISAANKVGDKLGLHIDTLSEIHMDRLEKEEYGKMQSFSDYAKDYAYATGGFPTRGDYFLANENGVPEYVGSIGGRTAVANTNQIIQGISYGVSMAQSEQNQLLRQQNEYLRRILEKPNGVFMNGRDVANELDRVQVARGAKVISGGY